MYNIVDVLLVVGLANKLQFFELHNTIRRAMKSPFHETMIGSSAFYESFVFSELDKVEQKVRYGIVSEGKLSFTKDEVSKFGHIVGATKDKKPIQPIQISAKDFTSITRQFPGAYVKSPEAQLILDGSAIIDLDATSMYPSNITQGNISFDCYIARVVPPNIYKIIKNVLQPCLGTGMLPPGLNLQVQNMVKTYVEIQDIDSKNETIAKVYYTVLSLFEKLINSDRTFDEICNPKDDQSSLLLRTMLIPLLDLFYHIHHEYREYNMWVYDYLNYVDPNSKNPTDNKELMKQRYPDGVWVIFNPNNSNTYMKQLSIDEIYEFINQEIISLSGCMFVKHRKKMGLFVDMLNDFKQLRSHHKKLRDTYVRGTKEYKLEDNNQNVFKRLMNTCYGLYGMSNFRYSNHWLSTSITTNSRYILKCCMAITEKYLPTIGQ